MGLAIGMVIAIAPLVAMAYWAMTKIDEHVDPETYERAEHEAAYERKNRW